VWTERPMRAAMIGRRPVESAVVLGQVLRGFASGRTALDPPGDGGLPATARAACALPGCATVPAWIHLAAKPPRPRLDEFLSRRRPNWFRRVRCLLPRRSWLAEKPGRPCTCSGHHIGRHQPDSRRGSDRCFAVEEGARGGWHRNDLRVRIDPCPPPHLHA